MMMSKSNFPQNSVQTSRLPFVEGRQFWRNLGIMTAFCLPVMYLGIILAVFVHEVGGHGLAALLLGGQFNGFGIAPDGLGWADIDVSGLPPLRQIFMLSAGALSTTVLSLVFFVFSLVFKKRRMASFTCLFFAIISILDGLPYFFWDAILLGGIGDFSIIWLLYPLPAMRVLVIGLGGTLMALAIIFFNAAFYKIAYEWLGEGKQIRLKGKITFSLAIFLLQAIGWFSFDWNQLIPGIGPLPSIAALAMVLLTLILLWSFHRPRRVEVVPPERPNYFAPVGAAWILCGGVLFVIVQWLQYGISFP